MPQPRNAKQKNVESDLSKQYRKVCSAPSIEEFKEALYELSTFILIEPIKFHIEFKSEVTANIKKAVTELYNASKSEDLSHYITGLRNFLLLSNENNKQIIVDLLFVLLNKMYIKISNAFQKEENYSKAIPLINILGQILTTLNQIPEFEALVSSSIKNGKLVYSEALNVTMTRTKAYLNSQDKLLNFNKTPDKSKNHDKTTNKFDFFYKGFSHLTKINIQKNKVKQSEDQEKTHFFSEAFLGEVSNYVNAKFDFEDKSNLDEINQFKKAGSQIAQAEQDHKNSKTKLKPAISHSSIEKEHVLNLQEIKASQPKGLIAQALLKKGLIIENKSETITEDITENTSSQISDNKTSKTVTFKETDEKHNISEEKNNHADKSNLKIEKNSSVNISRKADSKTVNTKLNNLNNFLDFLIDQIIEFPLRGEYEDGIEEPGKISYDEFKKIIRMVKVNPDNNGDHLNNLEELNLFQLLTEMKHLKNCIESFAGNDQEKLLSGDDLIELFIIKLNKYFKNNKELLKEFLYKISIFNELTHSDDANNAQTNFIIGTLNRAALYTRNALQSSAFQYSETDTFENNILELNKKLRSLEENLSNLEKDRKNNKRDIKKTNLEIDAIFTSLTQYLKKYCEDKSEKQIKKLIKDLKKSPFNQYKITNCVIQTLEQIDKIKKFNNHLSGIEEPVINFKIKKFNIEKLKSATLISKIIFQHYQKINQSKSIEEFTYLMGKLGDFLDANPDICLDDDINFRDHESLNTQTKEFVKYFDKGLSDIIFTDNVKNERIHTYNKAFQQFNRLHGETILTTKQSASFNSTIVETNKLKASAAINRDMASFSLTRKIKDKYYNLSPKNKKMVFAAGILAIALAATGIGIAVFGAAAVGAALITVGTYLTTGVASATASFGPTAAVVSQAAVTGSVAAAAWATGKTINNGLNPTSPVLVTLPISLPAIKRKKTSAQSLAPKMDTIKQAPVVSSPTTAPLAMDPNESQPDNKHIPRGGSSKAVIDICQAGKSLLTTANTSVKNNIETTKSVSAPSVNSKASDDEENNLPNRVPNTDSPESLSPMPSFSSSSFRQ